RSSDLGPGPEVQPDQAHAGVVNRFDERIDIFVARHWLAIKWPPKFHFGKPERAGGSGPLKERKFGEQRRAIQYIVCSRGINLLSGRISFSHHIPLISYRGSYILLREIKA